MSVIAMDLDSLEHSRIQGNGSYFTKQFSRQVQAPSSFRVQPITSQQPLERAFENSVVENIRIQLFEATNHSRAQPGEAFVALGKIRLATDERNFIASLQIIPVKTRPTKRGDPFGKESGEEIENARRMLDGQRPSSLQSPEIPRIGEQVVNVLDGNGGCHFD